MLGLVQGVLAAALPQLRLASPRAAAAAARGRGEDGGAGRGIQGAGQGREAQVGQGVDEISKVM